MSVQASGQGAGLWAECGDTFFTHSESLLGRLIRWGEAHEGDPTAWANHAGVVVESGWLVPPEWDARVPLAVVVEAMWHVQKVAWWDLYKAEYAEGLRIRDFYPKPGYTPEELLRFAAFANKGVGERYGWWKLLGFLAKKTTGIDVPSVFFVKSRPICSYYAAYTNEEARARGSIIPIGIRQPDGRSVYTSFFRWPGFGMPPQAADPDTMLDNITRNGCQDFWGERGA